VTDAGIAGQVNDGFDNRLKATTSWPNLHLRPQHTKASSPAALRNSTARCSSGWSKWSGKCHVDAGTYLVKLRDLSEDQPLSLTDAAEFLGKLTGRKPHVSTLWRWCLKGCRGVRLESICIGGKRFVTAAALEKFIADSTAARDGQPQKPSAPSALPSPAKRTLSHVMRHNERRRQEIEAARRRLDEITGTAKPPAPANRSA
jgi:hypothetical protein